MKKIGKIFAIFFIIANIFIVQVYAESYDECKKKCESSYGTGNPGYNSCVKEKCNDSNAATVPDGYDSIEDWQEDMNEKYERKDSTFDVSGGDGFNKGNIANGTANTKIKRSAQRIWGSFTLIAQILSFAGIIILGIRYMYMSADQRADVKKTFVYLIIGMILVFGASTVVQFVTNASTTVLK